MKSFKKGDHVVSVMDWYYPTRIEGYIAMSATQDPLHDYVVVTMRSTLEKISSEDDLSELIHGSDFYYVYSNFTFAYEQRAKVDKALRFYLNRILDGNSARQDVETEFGIAFGSCAPRPFLLKLRYYVRRLLFAFPKWLNIIFVSTIYMIIFDVIHFYSNRAQLLGINEQIRNKQKLREELSYAKEARNIDSIDMERFDQQHGEELEKLRNKKTDIESRLSSQSHGIVALIVAIISIILTLVLKNKGSN